jgi:PAS domain S-box-containing protein
MPDNYGIQRQSQIAAMPSSPKNLVRHRCMNPVRITPERLLLLILLSFIIAITAAGCGYARREQSEFERAAADQLRAIVDLKINQLARWRTELMNDGRWIMETANSDSVLRDCLAEPPTQVGRDQMQMRLDAWIKHSHYLRALLVNASRQVLLAAPKGKSWLGPAAITNTEAALQTNDAFISDLRVSVTTRRVIMALFVPLPVNLSAANPIPDGAPHRAAGVFVFEIDPNEFLFPLIQTWPTLSQSAETLLVRREGTNVLFLNNLRHGTNTAMQLRISLDDRTLPAVRAVLGEEGIVTGLDYRSVPVLAAIRRVPNSPWFLVAKLDQAEVYAPLHRQIIMIALITGSLALTASLGVGWVWRGRENLFAQQELADRDRAATQLSLSEGRYRLLFQEMISGFALHEIICDPENKPCDYRFLQVNPAFEQMTGLKAIDIVNRCASEIIPDLELSWIERYGRVALSGESTQFEDYSHHLKKFFEVRAFSPKPGIFAIVCHDITSRRRTEQEREQLTRELKSKNEDLEHLVYAASHDLRAPLINIEGFSRRLDKSCQRLLNALKESQLRDSIPSTISSSLGDNIAKDLGYIHAGVSKMNSLINGLLRLSRLGRIELQRETIDMNQLLEQVLSELALQIQMAEATIRIDPLPSCPGDPALLSQVFANLVDNALKYRDPARPMQILVSAHIANQMIDFCVADTGLGIAPEHQVKIFELFHRLNPQGPVAGEGLGLKVAQHILERHHGRVWVESHPGKGSQFHVVLPNETRT